MTREPREWTIGEHTFRLEPPDLLWVTIQGGCTLEEAVRIVRLYRELGEVSPVFVLSDMRASMGMDAESRRYMSDHVQHHWFRAMILYNTRLLHRAIARGLIIAASMTRAMEGPPRMKMHFVSTRDDALELLAGLRAQEDERPQNWK
ncbi:MAG: hypothetical protein ABW123_02270 [Cystobacter sp.]